MTLSSRPPRLAVGVLGLSLVSACSSGPEPSGESETSEATAPASTNVTISGSAPRASGGFPSVVILEPETDTEFPIPTEPALMDQYNTEFHPRLLLVRAGQKVRFKNSEDTLHNVHVIDIETRETAFNVATPVTGAFAYVFESPAVYDVSCGIHPSMAAFVVVTDSPFAVVANNDGTFSLAGVPPDNYTVTVWNLDPSRRSQRALTIDGDTTELSLDGLS